MRAVRKRTHSSQHMPHTMVPGAAATRSGCDDQHDDQRQAASSNASTTIVYAHHNQKASAELKSKTAELEV